ncbi:hypothetical protein HYW35_01275 [Candidatus Saccharibacteria bacterium]|nr:hypothetical protein [Candidatus Saccharibacteria bacterium]
MKLDKKMLLVGVIGLVVGALIILGERFITYKPERQPHYHANFAVYINGQKEQFKDIFYYINAENACSATAKHKMTPYERAHMHNSVNDVVHVEDEAVTWGQFFQNIGWVVDPKIMRTPDQVFLADAQNKITFIINGEQTDKVINSLIGDKDKLLVDFGATDNQTLQKEFQMIASTAGKYDGSKDSGSCGSASQEKNSWNDRLKHMF